MLSTQCTSSGLGDKVAEYGLAALVVGGAAAAAPKSDLLESLGKFLWLIIAAGVALLWAGIKRLFGRKLHGSPRFPR